MRNCWIGARQRPSLLPGLKAEIDELNARKVALKAELQKAQREEQDYAAMRRNVEDFLSPPQPERERKKNVELE